MSNIRTEIRASSISSYMGVGFNTPQEQLEIDLGTREPMFSKDQRTRMRVGAELEESILNFFEHSDWIGERIYDRNTERRVGYDGRVSYKIDGRTKDAIVEAKYSTSAQSFIFDLKYVIQGNIYMQCEGLDKLYLIGFDKGTPVWRIMHKDEELLADIEKVVENVHAILIGVLSPEDLDLSIAAKYQGLVDTSNPQDFDEDEDVNLVAEYARNKKSLKEIEDRNKEIEAYLKDKYTNVSYEKDGITFKVTPTNGRKTFDKAALQTDFPEMDLSQYEKVGAPSVRMTINIKEKAS